MAAPPVSVWGVHPSSVVMFAGYLYGLTLISRARSQPMWRPEITYETKPDVPDEEQLSGWPLAKIWLRFAMLVPIIGLAGAALEQSGEALAQRTFLSETVIGALLTATSTSLPELVTSIAAVRRGALTLAVSGIIGGNAFDTLFVAVSDFAYLEGSIYHAITERQIFLMALTILMTSVLLMGLLRREKSGIANIGLESFVILLLYIGSMALFFVQG